MSYRDAVRGFTWKVVVYNKRRHKVYVPISSKYIAVDECGDFYAYKCKPILVGCVYIPGDGTPDYFLGNVRNLEMKFDTFQKSIRVLRDR